MTHSHSFAAVAVHICFINRKAGRISGRKLLKFKKRNVPYYVPYVTEVSMKQNYQRMLDELIERECEGGKRPSLLLHACCAPCSSYVLEYLSEFFDITVFFYNPNISPKEEYEFREAELRRLILEMPLPKSVEIICCDYDPQSFDEIARGLESEPEGGSRCARCYRLRLRKTATYAAEHGFDFYTTTLSISPYKNAEWLNEIGAEEALRVGVRYLFSDFKKRNGYKRSCQLSAQYGLYRQDYCGCVYSKEAAEKRNKS